VIAGERDHAMSSERLPLGVFTTDDRLVIRTWDPWIAEATGIAAEQALNRPLTGVIPDLSPSGLAIIEDVLSHGTVQVMAAALHHYLFACAPLDSLVPGQRMQQHVTIGPLRDETRIVGIVVTVEDVTARVESDRRVAEGLGRHVESVAGLFGADRVHVRQLAVSTLAAHGHAVVDALVRTLRDQHRDLSVLSSVLDLLSISDLDVIEPLIGFLGDEDANLRIQAALILGQRRDRRAIAPLVARLRDADMNVRFHVIEALGRLRAVEASEVLTEIALERDFFLAFPAIQALSQIGGSRIAPRLVPLLSDELLRAPVIEALGELGDEDVSVPLVRLLNASDAPADVITHALSGLYDRYESRYGAGDHIADLVRREISATGTQSLLDAVQRVSADRLASVTKVLGWLRGDAVQRALTRLLGDGTVRSHVVEALVRNGAGVVPPLIEQLQAEDLDTRQAAAVALGRIGDRRGTAPLVAALDDCELAVAAAGALARIGDPAAFEGLITRLGDPDAAVRQSVIAALNSIGHAEMPGRIRPLLADPDPIVRESALKIAGYFGYPDCLDRVLACCRDDHEIVRRTAVEQLPFFDDPRVFDALEWTLAHDSAPVRAAAASALGRVEHPARTDALVRALDDADPWVRFLALRSVGMTGDPIAAPVVVARLESDPAPHVRLAAIEVIGRMTPAEALTVLEPLTRSPNDDIARAATAALGNVDREEALSILEQASRAPEAWKRLAAVDALARRREARVPQMLQWLAAVDGAPEVVSAAVDALARVGMRDGEQGSAAARALIALTAEPSRRESVIAVLSALPARRISDVIAGLRHTSTDVRCASVEALGRMKCPDASRALESALDDGASAVRLTAIAELKHLGARTSQRKLMVLARTDPDGEVRQAAMRAVAHADGPGLHSVESR
jgi:HEAT repeat protein